MGMETHHYIFQSRHLPEQIDDLIGSGNACCADFKASFTLDVLSVKQDLALVWLIHAGNAVKHRGLARTVRSNQAGDFSLFDLEAGIVDSSDSTKLDGYIVRFQ